MTDTEPPNTRHDMTSEPGRTARVNPWLAPAVIGVLHVLAQFFILFVLKPPTLSRVLNPRLYDEQYFHLHAIRTFAEQLPTPDLSDYRAATTPLYHLILALASQVIGDGDLQMRLVSGLFPLILSVMLARVIAGHVSTVSAVALTVPVACSPYILSGAVWALPDAAAWLGVVSMLLLCLRSKYDDFTLVFGAITLLFLVLTRQVHLWAASTLWLAAWIGSEHKPPLDNKRFITTVPLDHAAQRARRTLTAFVATLPAFIAVLWFMWIWGGLVPPEFQNLKNAMAASVGEGNATVHTGPNFATPAFFLAVVGLLSPFYLSAMLPEIIRRWKLGPKHTSALFGAGLTGFVLSVVVPTDFDPQAGRKSGIWNLHRDLVDTLPFIEIADRSLLVAGLAALGGTTLLLALSGCANRQRLIMGGSVIAFVTAQSANLQCWQRYHEPMAAVVLGLCIAFGRKSPPRWAYVGPVVLGLVLTAIVTLYLYRTDQIGSEPEAQNVIKHHLAPDPQTDQEPDQEPVQREGREEGRAGSEETGSADNDDQ